MYEFTSLSHPNEFTIFMGDDKYENEFLIAHGFKEDVWFHVDDYSSAHVYVRLPVGKTIKDLPEEIIQECCQLTKGNSIEGSKQPTVDLVYTPWLNLKKEKTMDTGTIGFHSNKDVIKVRNVARDRQMLKDLEKSRRHVDKKEEDYIEERRRRDRKEIEANKQIRKQIAAEAEQKMAESIAKKKIKNYVDLKVPSDDEDADRGDGTMEGCRAVEDDFM